MKIGSDIASSQMLIAAAVRLGCDPLVSVRWIPPLLALAEGRDRAKWNRLLLNIDYAETDSTAAWIDALELLCNELAELGSEDFLDAVADIVAECDSNYAEMQRRLR